MSVRWSGCLFTLLLVLTGLGNTRADISDLRLCADPECKEPISKGRTIIGYPSNDERILSFPVNAEVTVFSKEAGSRQDLWGVEIKGKRGYAPKQYIREQKIYVSKPEYKVSTGDSVVVEHLAVDSSKREVEGDSDDDASEDKARVEVKDPQKEEIVLSAEDVEYNHLKESVPEEHDGDTFKDKLKEDNVEEVEGSSKDKKTELNIEGEQHVKDNNVVEEREKKEKVEEKEEKKKEEKEKEEEEVVEEKEKEERENEEGEEEEMENTEEEEKVILIKKNYDQPNNDEDNKSEGKDDEQEEEMVNETAAVSESDLASSLLDIDEYASSKDISLDDIETTAQVDFEVIDGTTVYFDDATPFPPTTDVITPENFMPSSVTDEDYATVHPPPLAQALFEDAQGQNSDIHLTSSLSSEISRSVIIDGAIESVVPEPPVEPTETLPSELEPVEKTIADATEQTIKPTSSLMSDATGSVSSWLSTEADTEHTDEKTIAANEEESDSGEFAEPKEKSIIHDAEIADENISESEGFFSSWFGSSEQSENLEQPVETQDHSGITKSDKVVDEQSNLDTVSKESSTEASESDPNIIISPPDTMQTLVEPTESPEAFAQLPNTADDVDNAYNTQHSTLSSVDSTPEAPTAPDLELYTENPIEHDESLSAQDLTGRSPSYQEDSESNAGKEPDAVEPGTKSFSSLDDTLGVDSELLVDTENIVSDIKSDCAVASSENREHADVTFDSEVEDIHASPPDDEEEPGTSTARPLYAVPEPVSQDSPSDSSVEHDELSHLAGEGASMDEPNASDDDSADVSLSEGLLKTSHNLWLAISGALQLPEGLAFGFEAELAEPQVSSGMLVFLLIVSATVVVIYFVHLTMAKISREAPLLAALNRIDHENRVMAEEHESLHAELVKARTELETVSSRISTSNGEADELNSQLEIVKNEYASEKIQLEERIVQLEHELEEATTNGLEMHKMLSEMLSSQKDASAFQASVDHLQAMLDGQREKVETLTSDLALKNRLNEELHNELSSSLERASKLDYQVEQLTHSLEELTTAKGEAIRKLQEEAAIVEELKKANVSLTEQAGEYDSKVFTLSGELNELRDTINQLRESIETKESELQVAKECLKQLRLTSSDDHAAPDEEKLSALFDVIKVKAELQKVNNERLALMEQLQDAEMAQNNLEDAMASIRTEVAELRTHHDLAIRERQEAQSKLEVLTKYFEEKEAQLTKELESQEGLRVRTEGSAEAIAKKIQNYELELASYKTQVESLRKELDEQETSYKTQIASHEQKAHEYWLQTRAADRKHEEQRQENSQLRSRLTMLQKEKEDAQQSQVNIIKPTPKRVDANGTMSSPRPMVDGVDGDHSGPTSLHHDLDSPPIPPPPMHGPPMLPMMFPPGGPLPPGVPPPHGLHPGVPPPPPGMPHGVPPPHGLPHGVPPPHGLPHGVPPPHGLPHGVPPPHGLPPHPFLPGEPPFMGPLPPLPGDRRLPPAGGMSSPPFRRSGSPSYDHRNDRYSPLSDRSHMSDRRYSPPPLRRRPLSPDMHRNRSPERRSDRMRSPDRRSDRMRSPDHRNDRRLDRRSPDRHYTRSPDGYMRHRTSPRNYYDDPEYNNDDSRLRSHHVKGKKTSTPLGPSDR